MKFINFNINISTKNKDTYYFALFLIVPGILLFSIFVLLPVIETLFISFTNWNGYSKNINYVGFDTYFKVIDTYPFSQALRNSIIFGIFGLIVPPTIGLIAASIVEDSNVKYKAIYRFLFFVPYFFSMGVAAAVFCRAYDPTYGVINNVIQSLGFPDFKPQWLGNHILALPSAMVVLLWHETAICFIVYSAAIQQIDKEIYNAAKVDGANTVQLFWNITIPSLRKITLFIRTIMMIVGFTPYAVIYPLTTPGLGGPYYATEVLPTLIFKKARIGSSAGEAAVVGVIMVLLVLFSVYLLRYISERFTPSVDTN